MLIVKVDAHNSIDRALKTFKFKFNRTGVIKTLRKKKQFTKPSAVRREELIDAKYKESKRREDEN